MEHPANGVFSDTVSMRYCVWRVVEMAVGGDVLLHEFFEHLHTMRSSAWHHISCIGCTVAHLVGCRKAYVYMGVSGVCGVGGRRP
jgi:hypothetical protein